MSKCDFILLNVYPVVGLLDNGLILNLNYFGEIPYGCIDFSVK